MITYPDHANNILCPLCDVYDSHPWLINMCENSRNTDRLAKHHGTLLCIGMLVNEAAPGVVTKCWIHCACVCQFPWYVKMMMYIQNNTEKKEIVNGAIPELERQKNTFQCIVNL